MGWAPDLTKFSQSFSEKKKSQKAGFLRPITAKSWKLLAHKRRKRKEGKKEREGRKQENRKIAMAGFTFRSYMMVTSIWRKFLAEKKYTCLKEEVYSAVTFSKIRVDVYFSSFVLHIGLFPKAVHLLRNSWRRTQFSCWSRSQNLSSIFCHAGYDKALAATNLKFWFR